MDISNRYCEIDLEFLLKIFKIRGYNSEMSPYP